MSTPAPRRYFDSDEDYLLAFWEMSEFGVRSEDVDFFRTFFGSGKCPQTLEEVQHRNDLPEFVKVYRGYCSDTGHLDGLSWTPDKQRAIWFASRYPNKSPTLAAGEIHKDNIAAIILGREQEYIILDICDFEEDALSTKRFRAGSDEEQL